MRHERNFSPSTALGRSLGRQRTVDMMTFDSAAMTTDGGGNMRGKSLGGTFKTWDGRTVDSTGAFLVGELERLDLTLHEPLAAVTWGRDIQLREDVTTADEVSSFTVSTYGWTGGLGTGQVAGSGVRHLNIGHGPADHRCGEGGAGAGPAERGDGRG